MVLIALALAILAWMATRFIGAWACMLVLMGLSALLLRKRKLTVRWAVTCQFLDCLMADATAILASVGVLASFGRAGLWWLLAVAVGLYEWWDTFRTRPFGATPEGTAVGYRMREVTLIGESCGLLVGSALAIWLYRGASVGIFGEGHMRVLLAAVVYLVFGVIRVGADFAQPRLNQPSYVTDLRVWLLALVVLLWPWLVLSDVRDHWPQRPEQPGSV